MIELILICMGKCNVHTLMNDQDSTWMSQVSGLRKELLQSLPTQSLGESPAPCLLMSWSELAALRPEDFELILLGPWGINFIPCLFSLRGRLWITPRELQLHSLHWNQLSPVWWSATGCALLSIQPNKIGQKLTVSLDFKSTAGWGERLVGSIKIGSN